MRTLVELRKRAWREMILNPSITVYDGDGLNRRRPPQIRSFDQLTAGFNKLQETVQAKLFASMSRVAKTFEEFNKSLPCPCPAKLVSGSAPTWEISHRPDCPKVKR